MLEYITLQCSTPRTKANPAIYFSHRVNVKSFIIAGLLNLDACIMLRKTLKQESIYGEAAITVLSLHIPLTDIFPVQQHKAREQA